MTIPSIQAEQARSPQRLGTHLKQALEFALELDAQREAELAQLRATVREQSTNLENALGVAAKKEAERENLRDTVQQQKDSLNKALDQIAIKDAMLAELEETVRHQKESLRNALELDPNGEAELAQLRQQIQEHEKSLENAKAWFNGFNKLENWLLEQGLWGDSDIRDGDPAQTLINGILRNLTKVREDAARAAEERDALAAGIHAAAAKAGIIEEATPVSGPQLLMLCDNLSDGMNRANNLHKDIQDQLSAQNAVSGMISTQLEDAARLLERAIKHHTCTTVPVMFERYGSLEAAKTEGKVLWAEDIPLFLKEQAAAKSKAMAAYEKARAAYKDWLYSSAEDLFAPATREEVLALYDQNCRPFQDKT